MGNRQPGGGRDAGNGDKKDDKVNLINCNN